MIKHFIDVMTCFCTGFEVVDIVCSGKGFALVRCYLSFRFLAISLVGDQHYDGVAIIFQVFHPGFDTLKRTSVCDRIREYYAAGSAVVGAGYCAVPLLADGVPYLQADPTALVN
jgi:hypothetical protein